MKNPGFIIAFCFVLALQACQVKDTHTEKAVTKYTCSMHPQVIQDHPGVCPICGMQLVLVGSGDMHDGTITLSESQIRLGNIKTISLQGHDFESSIPVNAKLRADDEQIEVISSRSSGRIEKLYAKETGKGIEKGQALYEIYSEQLLTLQQEYLLAINQAEILKEKQYSGFVKSAEKKLLRYGMAPDQIEELAKRKSPEAKIYFRSPVSGVITTVNVIEGQYVEEGIALYQLAKFDKLWVEAELYGSEDDLLTVGDDVTIFVNGFENNTVLGKVVFLSPEYRNGSQVMIARALIGNTSHQFIPGMEAHLLLKEYEKNALVLPLDAVIRSAEGDHVWLVEKNGSFRPHPVKTGMETSEEIEITEGLSGNETVVISGAYLLYAELVLKKGDHTLAEQMP